MNSDVVPGNLAVLSKSTAGQLRAGDMDLSLMRTPYRPSTEAFLESDLVAHEPFAQFQHWFDEACNHPDIKEPNAAALATSTRDGKPSCRMILVKGFGRQGFRFFSNYEGRKAQEIVENPHVALMFYWEPPNRSVRIEGKVEKLSEEESSGYFVQRPVGSQVAASVSPQSTVIPNRTFLTDRADRLLADSKQCPLSKPTFWGGYNVVPDVFEFWQGQTNRMHDRIRFRRMQPNEKIDQSLSHIGDDGWLYERLAP
jgi:pyridoxamine 5'-phosphate oxidase